jgi:hypothetical protein
MTAQGPMLPPQNGGQPSAVPQGVKIEHYDLTKGEYGVTVSVGKSYQTKMQQGLDTLGQLIQAAPDLFPVLGYRWMQFNDSIPGHEEIAEDLKKLRPPQLQDDDQAEPEKLKQQLAQLGQQHEILVKELNAKNQIIETDQVKTQGDLDKAKIDQQTKIEVAKLERDTKIVTAAISAKMADSKVLQEIEASAIELLMTQEHAARKRRRRAHTKRRLGLPIMPARSSRARWSTSRAGSGRDGPSARVGTGRRRAHADVGTAETGRGSGTRTGGERMSKASYRRQRRAVLSRRLGRRWTGRGRVNRLSFHPAAFALVFGPPVDSVRRFDPQRCRMDVLYGRRLLQPDQLVRLCVERVILVATTTRDAITAGTTGDLIRLLRRHPDAKFMAAIGIYISNLRQQCATLALQTGASHLLFVDADMRFPEDTIDRLVAWDVDLVGANYVQRTIPEWWTARKDGASVSSVGRTGHQCVDFVGFGVMLISRELFETLERPWFDTPYEGGTHVGEDLKVVLPEPAGPASGAQAQGCRTTCGSTTT